MAIKKIYLTETGDHSVGEGDSEITINFSDEEVELDGECREDFRKELAKLFNGYFSEGCGYEIMFSDECADCGAQMKDGKCPNKNCIGKPPEDIAKLEEKRRNIFAQVEHLDNVIHALEATANVHYKPDDKMWNVLLKARDRINKDIENEKMRLFAEAKKIDAKMKEIVEGG